MSQVDRKALVRQYKETPLPIGVYRIRNTAAARSLVGSSVNLPGMLNRQRFQLENGSHPNAELQAHWNELGPGAFEFEVLDRLKPAEDPDHDTADELSILMEMWIERLTDMGESLYRQSGRSA